MKKYVLVNLLIVGMVMLPGLLTAAEAGSTHYLEMSSHYEVIRLSLLADSMGDVVEHARAIGRQAADVRENISTDLAGVPAHDLDQWIGALEEIEASAMKLAGASDLELAREEFSVLTKPMAKLRKLTGAQSTVVAYCPMAQKAWIQPEGEIGNPYYGQEMPNCGQVVGE